MKAYEILKTRDTNPGQSPKGVNVICGSSCDIDVVCCGDAVCCDWACCNDNDCFDACFTGCLESVGGERF